MKKPLRFTLFAVLIVFVTLSANSQTSAPQRNLQKIRPVIKENFFEIQKEFNNYWDSRNVVNGYYEENGVRVKAAGWKQFKRWEYYWENRVDPQTGAFPETGRAEVYQQIRDLRNSRSSGGNWQSLGPSTSGGGYAGLGRINVVGFRPGDNNTLYAGSPSGGLWKTTDGGSNWSVLTDENAVLGVSDVVVIAGGTTATDVVYIATGDRDGGSMHSLSGDQFNDNNSIGVLKSTDGGTTWTATALTFTTNLKRRTNRLLKHPGDDNIIYASASDNKVYKTTDGGVTWPSIYTGVEFVSMEFKPGDPTIMYGATRAGAIYRSTDSGVSWSFVTNTGGSRVQLAVSADDATVVYAVANGANGLDGIYQSTNSGSSYTKVFDGSVSGHNLLGYYCNGTGTDTQGSYDLCIAADPTDASTLYVGGVNTWKSTNGGVGWSPNNMWTASSTYNSCGSPVVHADKHFLGFQPGSNTLFEGNDGGIYKTSNGGSSWTFISSGMEISQLYRIGVSQTSSSDVIAGLQDNGTKTKSGATWTDVLGGDGMECAIDYTTTNTQYGEIYNGDIKRTTNGWTNYVSITPGLSGSAAWVTPFTLDPNTNTTLYIGYQDVWKSTNQGTAWTQISSWGGNTLRSLAVAPSNSNTIYAATQTILYVTTDGGSNWTNITGTLPVGSSYITYISVKADDPLTAWVSFGEYNSFGVYETTDGGSSWTNISGGLPNIPVMCVIQNKQNTAESELYAATDVGVYVKVGSANWTAFSTGLPNVVVTELEIYYNEGSPNLSRLRAATFGRGLWESDLYSPATSPPVADFSADILYPGVGQTVTFTDLSTNSPSSWTWAVSPATVTYTGGTSSSSQNPQIQFDAEGDYTVQLTATNAYGSDVESKTNYISVSALQSYCAASASNISTTGNPYISGVQIGTISNTGTGSNAYTGYTSMSTNATINQSVSITITVALVGYAPNYYNSDADIGIWIDWNQNGDFTDIGENVACQSGMTNTQGVFSFSAPGDASLGATTMRVRVKYFDADCGQPCGTTSYGEVEDYKIVVLPATNTWTGSSSTDWATAGNWSANLVPSAAMNVIIPTTPTGGVFPIISSSTLDATVNNLTIQSGASVSIAGHLQVNGTLTNSAGVSGIVIESSASSEGSLITDTDGVSGTVKRYLTGGKWHQIGAPVSGATVNNLYFGGSPDVWLKSYNESSDTWSYISNVNTPMPQGSGFATWVEVGNNVTSSFTGTMKATDMTITTPTLAFTDASHGYNLVANPYPAALDWDIGGWTRTNIDGTIYIWKDGSNYLTRNEVGLGSLTDGIIPKGQGFFIRATAASPSLTIPKLARVQSSVEYMKQASNFDEPPYAVFDVRQENLTDEVWVTFADNCTDLYDEGWDAMKLFGSGNAPQLYVNQNDDKLSIAAYAPLATQERHVSMNFEARVSGDHILVLHDQNALEAYDILLEDLHLDKIQDLNINPTYTYPGFPNDDPNRFLIHFNPKAVGISQNNDNNLVGIYSWDNKVIIKSLDENGLQDVRVEIVDMMGRQIAHREIDRLQVIKIPVQLSNTFLIVSVISEKGRVIKKVFVQ